MVPTVALLCCLSGLLGLYLPLLHKSVGSRSPDGLRGLFDAIDLSVAAVPWLGLALTVLFLGLSALPVADLARRRVHVTGWLTVPAVIGLLPMVPFAWATFAVADFGEALGWLLPEDTVGVGAGIGSILLLFAEVGLLIVGPIALVGRFGNGRAGAQAPPPPPPYTDPPLGDSPTPRSPYL